ncbi:LysR substrate-binding domain-containing protein [Nocardia sp. NPDC005366]|uniref:LysR family transcriptional regulator n=1 Tax=Nocardia sp. NPDC005366 TaxID=3156878 RepID=UPI0033B9F608
MELKHVKAFLAVAEELHFGRAAARLQMASAPLSRMIQQLERYLGARLFVRTTRTVRLTAAGRALLGPANDIIAAFTAAERCVTHACQGVIGNVSVGFAGPSTHSLISTLAQAIRIEQPGIELSLSSTMYGSGTLNQLSDRNLDLAIVHWDSTPVGMGSRVVSLNYYRIAVPANHRLADRSEVEFAELANEAWVLLPSSGSLMREETIKKAEAIGFTPRVVQEAPDTSTIMALVAAGVGITMTVDTAVANGAAQGIRVLSIADDRAVAPWRLVWRSDDDNPALQRVLEISNAVLPTPPGFDDRRGRAAFRAAARIDDIYPVGG